MRDHNGENVQDAPRSTMMEGVREKSVFPEIPTVRCLISMEKWSKLQTQNILVRVAMVVK